MFSELLGSVVWYLTLICGKYHHCLKECVLLLSLPSFWSSHHVCVIPFVVASHSMGILLFYPVFVRFDFLVLKISVDRSLSSEIPQLGLVS